MRKYDRSKQNQRCKVVISLAKKKALMDRNIDSSYFAINKRDFTWNEATNINAITVADTPIALIKEIKTANCTWKKQKQKNKLIIHRGKWLEGPINMFIFYKLKEN